MGSRKIKRALVILLSLLMLMTSLPLTLVASANGGGSGDGDAGSSGSIPTSDDALNDEDIGLRFYLVTKKSGKSSVVKTPYKKGGNAVYYLDVWHQTGITNNYNNVISESRYSVKPSKNNIIYGTASSTDSNINNVLKNSLGYSNPNINFSSYLKPGLSTSTAWFTESGGFNVSGSNFNNWMMAKAGTKDGRQVSRYEMIINFMLGNTVTSVDLENTYLVVEPIVRLARLSGNNQSLGTYTVASWYGYIAGQTKDAGECYTLRNRLINLGKGFRLDSSASSANRINIQNVLGLKTPDSTLVNKWNTTGGSNIQFNNSNSIYNTYKTHGFGIQVYWLKDSSFEDPKTPVDTYDIINKPTKPGKSETPKKDTSNNPYDNTGNITIVKTYIDLYKDKNESSYYTQIEDNSTYKVKSNSDKVVISDESGVNGGYKVYAWYTSKTDASSANESNLKGSAMITKTNNVETIDTQIAKQKFKIGGYTNISGITSNGSLRYTKSNLGNLAGTKKGQYIGTYKRLAVLGQSKKTDGTYLQLGTQDKTLVILYVKEHSYINRLELVIIL